MNTQKKKYIKPTLKKYGKMVEITMRTTKGSGMFDVTNMADDSAVLP
jgi:hypothetical protein